MAGTDDLSDDAEFLAHFEASGPVAAARRWLGLVLADDDIEGAWPLTHPNLRLCLVQTVIWANTTPPRNEGYLDQLAEAYSDERPASHELEWESMKRSLAKTLRDKWEGTRIDQWLPIRPRVVDPSHELALFVDPADGRDLIPHGETFEVIPILMAREGDRWLAAGFGGQPPEPGWPPNYPEGPITLD